MIGPISPEADAPAVRGAAGLAGGILLGSAAVSGTGLAAALMPLALLWRLGLRDPLQGEARRRAAVVLFWIAAGFVSGRLRVADETRLPRLAAGGAPDDVGAADRVEGVLTDFWSGAPPEIRGRMRAERRLVGNRWVPFSAEVFLSVSGEGAADSVADRGDRVRVTGRLRPEDLPASTRDLDLPWRRCRLAVKSARLIARREGTLLSWLHAPNRFLFCSIPSRSAEFDRDVRGPLAALLLGRTSELDRGVIARFRRGGLYHLLVVSGLHVALAAGLAYAALRGAGVRGKARDAALLAAVTVFVLIGGANPPAVRAGLVVGVFLIARLLERPIRGAQAAGLSAIMLLLVAPREVFSLGCVLTFAAVVGIALFTEPIRARLPERPRWIFSGLATALGAQAATAPVLLWRFNLMAAGAWLTAPLSLPLAAGLIAVGSLLLALFAAGIVVAPLASVFAFGVRGLEVLAERAAGVAFLRPTPPLSGILAVEALLFGAAFAPRRLRVFSAAAAGALFLGLALAPGAHGPRRGFSMEALDVGQGDAILLRWDRRAMLVDGGGPFDRDARDFGRTRLLPKLLDRGVTRLDAVLLTHPHPDHAVGLFAVLQELRVGVFWHSDGEDEGDLYRDLDDLARRRRIPVAMPRPGDALALGDARLSVLQSGGPPYKQDAVNNQSVIALFERDGRRALLTGDAGAASERELLRSGVLSPVDALKVGHHGSRGSTTRAFLDAVCPRVAILSCGRENRFGHPAPETLANLADARIPLFRTDVCSDVLVELGPRSTRVSLRGDP